LEVDGEIGVLKNQYHHYTYGNISDQIQTIDHYSKIAATDLFESGKKFSLLKLLFHPPFRFVKEYLFKSGFRDGLPGFIIIVSTMFYVFIKYAKLWELTHSTAPPRPELGSKASPIFEEKIERRRSGEPLPAAGRLSEPQAFGGDAEGLTISQKEKENDS